MTDFIVSLPGGALWTPQFVTRIDQEKCIGCGRCFKVCARDVLALAGLTENGDYVAVDIDGDDDDEYEKKVMTLAYPENCIGCEACSKLCPKKCYSHAPAQV